MPLKLSRITLQDFDTMINHATLYPPGDDLVGPPTTICWPVTTPSEAHARLTFHMTKQKSRFLGDALATYLKITDSTTGDIVSIARWHYYPSGYSYPDSIHWELHTGNNLPEEMNVKLHNYILSTRDGERKNWMRPGPCLILMHMVTRISQRGRGAAGMLIKYGVEMARERGVPAYLEAGVLGKPIYEKFGFKEIAEPMSIDLRPFGIEVDFPMARMEFVP